MKTTNRLAIFALATFSSALVSGCIAGDVDDADMVTEDEASEETNLVAAPEVSQGYTIAKIEALRVEMLKIDPTAKITTHCAIAATPVNTSGPALAVRESTTDPLEIGNCFFSEEELDAFLAPKDSSDALAPGGSLTTYYELTKFYADVIWVNKGSFSVLEGAGDSTIYTASGPCGGGWYLNNVGSYWNDKFSFVEGRGTCNHAELYENAYLSGYSLGTSNSYGTSYPLTQQYVIWPFRTWNDEVTSIKWND